MESVYGIEVNEIIQILTTFFVGIISAFIGVIGGGRGLISISFLLLFNLPIEVAIATSKIGGLGSSIGGVYKFIKSGKVVWKYVIPLTLIAVVGGYIGANMLIQIDKDLLTPIVAIMLLLILPMIFVKTKIGEIQRFFSRTRNLTGYFVYFLLAIYGGVFGGGVGIFIVFAILYFFGLTIIQVKATNMIPRFVLNIAATFVFITEGIIDYYLGIALFLGMLIGGYLGAHTAIKKGNKRVKFFFVIVVLSVVIKLLFPHLKLFVFSLIGQL